MQHELQLHNRVRDLDVDSLLSLYGSLARLGYAPRAEVGSGLHAASSRLMPLMTGEQLAALGYYAASFERYCILIKKFITLLIKFITFENETWFCGDTLIVVRWNKLVGLSILIYIVCRVLAWVAAICSATLVDEPCR